MDTNVTHLQALGGSRLAPSPRPQDALPYDNSTNYKIYFSPFLKRAALTLFPSKSNRPKLSFPRFPPRFLKVPPPPFPPPRFRALLFLLLLPSTLQMYRRSFFFPSSPHTQRRKMGAMMLTLEEEEEEEGRSRFSINDNVDLLVEILGRLDGRSLGVAACVCRLWSSVCRRDSVWEALCNRHVVGEGGRPGTRSVVAALGGYRRLYRLCVGPALDRLSGEPGRSEWASAAHISLSLSLSLFSIDCYERLGGPRASLLFLCKPVDVS